MFIVRSKVTKSYGSVKSNPPGSAFVTSKLQLSVFFEYKNCQGKVS